MPKLIAKYAADNPFPWYKSFLLDTVIPNSHVFATLTALGEVGVGLSLLFGLLTPLGAFFGLIQVLFYGMAVQQQSSGQQGFHVMLFVMMLTFLFARAGQAMGPRREAARALAEIAIRAAAHVSNLTATTQRGRPKVRVALFVHRHSTRSGIRTRRPCAGVPERVVPSCEH